MKGEVSVITIYIYIYIYINDKNPDESKAVVDEIFV